MEEAPGTEEYNGQQSYFRRLHLGPDEDLLDGFPAFCCILSSGMTNASVAPTAYDSIREHKTILGHPAGLFVLFFTEMWERFSYYGMRALLVLYMVNYLIKGAQTGTFQVAGFAGLQHGLEAVFGPLNVQPLASQIYGLYTALVYLTPLFGGFLAAKFIGQRKAVILGGLLMAVGQF